MVLCSRCHGGARWVRAGVGSVSVAAEDLDFPNGCAIAADGRTRIVTESVGMLRDADRGELLDRVEGTESLPVASMLGGVGRKAPSVPTTINAGPEALVRERKSKVESVEVDGPGAGWPT